jgi:hypothetical protein
MAKFYYLSFGSGNPANYSGLTPTFTVFHADGVTSLAAPGVTETPAGSGFYRFQYGATTSILFMADGGAGLAAGDRFVKGTLDPIQIVDQRVGTISDSFGSTSIDPTTVYGYLKRMQELLEGNATFTKATGTWQISSRGSSTLLREKSLTNTTTQATKA